MASGIIPSCRKREFDSFLASTLGDGGAGRYSTPWLFSGMSLGMIYVRIP